MYNKLLAAGKFIKSKNQEQKSWVRFHTHSEVENCKINGKTVLWSLLAFWILVTSFHSLIGHSYSASGT